MALVSGSWFTFAAGRRAKWFVFAIWFAVIFIAAGPANLPSKFEEAENNEATSYLPGSAESTAALKATEELQNGEIAPAVIVFRRRQRAHPGRLRDDRRDRRQDGLEGIRRRHRRRRHGGLRRQARSGSEVRRRPRSSHRRLRLPDHRGPRPARRLRPLRRPGLLEGRQGGDRQRLHQRRRRGRTDHRRGPVLARPAARGKRAAAWKRRSPAAPASPPTRSKSSKASTGPCCWPRSCSWSSSSS